MTTSARNAGFLVILVLCMGAAVSVSGAKERTDRPGGKREKTAAAAAATARNGPRPEEESTGAEREDDATARVLAEEKMKKRVVGLLRVRVSRSQRLSAGVGAMVARMPADFDCTTVCDYRGAVFQVEPGTAGAQLAAGYALVLGEKRHNDYFLAQVYAAFGVKAAVLRTWGDSSAAPPGRTYAGVEGDFTITQVHFTMGVFRRISDPPGADPWLVSGGIGWGF